MLKHLQAKRQHAMMTMGDLNRYHVTLKTAHKVQKNSNGDEYLYSTWHLASPGRQSRVVLFAESLPECCVVVIRMNACQVYSKYTAEPTI